MERSFGWEGSGVAVARHYLAVAQVEYGVQRHGDARGSKAAVDVACRLLAVQKPDPGFRTLLVVCHKSTSTTAWLTMTGSLP